MTVPATKYSSTITKAMILAAGLGTRLKPWTDNHPKALAIVNGKSLLQRNIEYLQQFGIYDVVVNVHHFAEQLIAAITNSNGWGSTITISDESDAVLETGGGILNAASYFKGNEPFIVLNADILTDMNLARMIEFHHQHQPLVTLATSSRQTSRYLLFNDKNHLCGWRNITNGHERTVPETVGSQGEVIAAKAFSGIHVIDAKLFSLTQKTGKFSIIDVYIELMTTQAIQSFEDNDSRFLDVGKPESLALAQDMFR